MPMCVHEIIGGALGESARSLHVAAVTATPARLASNEALFPGGDRCAV
jgi:hypothetical protein